MVYKSLHTSIEYIYRAFTCRNTDVLIRAYLTYVRPLVEHDSIIWSPYTVKDALNLFSAATQSGYLDLVACPILND